MRLLVALGVLVGLAGTAAAQRAQFDRIERPHADVPFNLDLLAEGFDEQPAIQQPKLDIPGATVTPVGVQPNVSRSIQIINGKRTDATLVTWQMRWRVHVKQAGSIRVPSVTIKQGDKSATAQGGQVTVSAVPTTDAMKLRLVLPDRTVFVGETVPVKLEWLFRAQPENQTFSVPFTSLDAFIISAPPVPQGSRKAIELPIGTKDLAVPFEVDQTEVDGVEHNRLTVTLFAAPKLAGKVEIPAASVVAALRVGRSDFFGNARTEMFRVSDIARMLEVKALPETDRPPAFAGAVGEQFSIEVRTSRSVVSLGEPVELDVTIKSDQRLDTLALGKLDAPGRLPKDKFTAPAEPPIGELSADGKSKRFLVYAQVTGPATEIPALAFSYFDPRKGTYHTIHSEPIALSVKGGSVVDASSVVIGRKGPAAAVADEVDVAAQLALSAPGASDSSPLGGTFLWVLVAFLYAVPLALLGFRTWQLRTAESREDASEVRAARTKVEQLLDRAQTAPARDIAGPLVTALTELARVLGRRIDDHGLLAKLETESFAPEAANKPLSPDVRSDAAGLLRRWAGDARRARRGKPAAAVMLLVTLAASRAADAASLEEGRMAYQYAMEQTNDATARKTAFARAAVALAQAAAEHPDRPELLADWGNAALGAGDVATATLAYRRALALDPGNSRARHNLAYLRDKLPDAFKPAAVTSASDTLLFFHRWPRGWRLLVGAVAFAIGVLLVVPWSAQRRRWLRGIALLPFAAWLALVASLVLENRHTNDAIVMDGVVLRAADSAGAPATLPQPLPRGAEVTIREHRDTWTRIELPNGTHGWVPGGAVQRVTP